jgi:hypothetical protein
MKAILDDDIFGLQGRFECHTPENIDLLDVILVQEILFLDNQASKKRVKRSRNLQ